MKMELVWCITEKYPDEHFNIHTEYSHDKFEKAKADLIKYSKDKYYDFDYPMYLTEMTKQPISDFFPDDEHLSGSMIESIEESIVDQVGDWFEIKEEDKKAMQEIISKCIAELKKLPVFSSEVYHPNIGKNYSPIYTVEQGTREVIQA
jgi:hypothetical protein